MRQSQLEMMLGTVVQLTVHENSNWLLPAFKISSCFNDEQAPILLNSIMITARIGPDSNTVTVGGQTAAGRRVSK